MSYVTKQYQAVLQCLEARDSAAFTAAELAEDLRLAGHPVGLATVYRQLDKLETAGVVHKVPTEEGALYQRCPHPAADHGCFLLLVRDGGLRGVVLCLGKDFARIAVRGEEIFAQAGAALGALALAARDAGLAGLEFAAGIPGSVGGAAAMNAGAYGGEIAQVLRSARVLQPDGEIVDMENADLAFGYRTSALQAPGRICLGARFVLQRGDREEISGRMADLAARRREKQPLQFPSAGSFFKRPEGYFAGRLIEEAGLKGAHVGGAQVSSLHAGFLINTGGATAGDFLALMERVQRAVYEREGVRLEPEVRILGQDGAEEVG